MSTLLATTLNIFCGIVSGAKDSLIGILAIHKIHLENEKLNKRAQKHHKANNHSSPKQTFSVYQRLAECCGFNIGVFALSIVLFNLLFLPYMFDLMKFIFGHEGRVVRIWSWLNPILLYTFGAFWVLPLFVLSRFVNAFWFQDIAELAFRGRTQSVRSVSFFIADTLFSLIIQALFLIQAVMVGKLFYIGQFASIFHLSLLYSLYSFEYKWFNHGWELHRRLHFIENNWPYFFGFGLPLAILTSIPQSYLLSGSIFSTLFPLFIISSNEAKPTRQPTSDLPLQLFSPVVFLSNRIFQITIYLNSSRYNKTKS